VKASVFVPVRDGTLLACDLHRPGQAGVPAAGRFPGLVAELTPYSALRLSGGFDAEADYFAAHGYDVLVCDIRGTGDSGGVWTQIDSPLEAQDDYDLVEWLAAEPWSTGRIGQEGFSYGGFTSLRVAALQPPHLVAIAPLSAQDNLYLDDPYKGGMWDPAQPPWPTLAQALSGGRIQAAAEIALWRSHPTWDAFWQQIAISTKYAQIQVPVLATGGWEDTLLGPGAIGNYLGLKSHDWTIYGPWPHANPFAFPGAQSLPPDPVPPGALLALWDRWLLHLQHAPLPSSHFTSFEEPQGTSAGWQQLGDWPPSDVHATKLALTSDGRLSQKAASDDVSFQEPALAQLAILPNGAATFDSGVLAGDSVVAGSVDVHLHAILDQPDANFDVQLLDVAPDGTATLVKHGYLRASHRLSHSDPTPVVPGQPTDFDIPVIPDDWRFAAGHRLRIVISGGDPTQIEPLPYPVTTTILTGRRASYAVFPLRGSGGNAVP
jgi:predicted acyl esterase